MQSTSTSLNRPNGLVKEGFIEPLMSEQSSNDAAGKQEHNCPICGKKFSRKSNRNRHIESHGKGVVCEICMKTLSRLDKLEGHIKVHTRAAIPLRSTIKSVVRITWSESTHAKRITRRNAQPIPGREKEYDDIVDLAMSYPAKYRYEGGKMTRGPVARRPDPFHHGNQKAFDKQGRLRDQYGFLDERIPVWRGIPKVPTPNGRLGLRPRDQQKVGPAIPPLPMDRLRGTEHQRHPPPFTAISDTRCGRDWRPPKRWRTDFPKHPMDIPRDAPKCEMCHLCSVPLECLDCDSCKCIYKIREGIDLKVVDDGARGEGLMAFARKNDSDDFKTRQKPLCRKGDVIGELPGDIKNKEPGPNWSFEITRRDLDPKLGTIGVIYCRDISNNWRKINHTCKNANVEFEEKTVSFRRRLVAVAARDIYSGDWLLTNYGPEFWKGREKDCLCGGEECISLRSKNGTTNGGKLIRPSESLQREVGRDVANIVHRRSKQSVQRRRQAKNGHSNRPSKRR